jgi:hypothetical protein
MCLQENAEIEAGEVLKIKVPIAIEITGVIDCFQDKPNKDIGVFWRTLNRRNRVC